MENHSRTFENLINSNSFDSYTNIINGLKPQEYFLKLMKDAILLESQFLSQEIEFNSDLGDSEYDKHLNDFLNESNNKALPLTAKITGIEDEKSVVYIENDSPTNFFLTSYQTLNPLLASDQTSNPLLTGIEGLLCVGNVEILGNVDAGKLPFIIDPIFYGIINNKLFVELEKEDEHLIEMNIKYSAVAYIEQLAFLQKQEEGEVIISIN